MSQLEKVYRLVEKNQNGTNGTSCIHSLAKEAGMTEASISGCLSNLTQRGLATRKAQITCQANPYTPHFVYTVLRAWESVQHKEWTPNRKKAQRQKYTKKDMAFGNRNKTPDQPQISSKPSFCPSCGHDLRRY